MFMDNARKWVFSRMLDLPFAAAAVFTTIFYTIVLQESMEGTVLQRYTTEHAVEYVIVGFFIWGMMDVIFRMFTFPREKRALRHEFLPPRGTREPVSKASELLAHLKEQPASLRNSRMGQRLIKALSYLEEKGSADGFSDYLDSLSDQDNDQTHDNYGLVRFIGWVTPVLGFLGTVLYFGMALAGLTVDEMADQLPIVVSQMGAAFNTTTVALGASTAMMFLLFLCERAEQKIVHTIDRRAERELLNRFEVADASLTPFLNALQALSGSMLQTMDSSVDRQLRLWSNALQTLQERGEERQLRQAQVWEETILRMQKRFEEGEAERERRLLRVLEAIEMDRTTHHTMMKSTIDEAAKLRGDFARLTQTLANVLNDEGKLLELQNTLSANLRLLRESQQIDEALHGLTAAIHLMTSRHGLMPPKSDQRAA
jgi:biopolymer transport protein ExbB/TolQ